MRQLRVRRDDVQDDVRLEQRLRAGQLLLCDGHLRARQKANGATLRRGRRMRQQLLHRRRLLRIEACGGACRPARTPRPARTTASAAPVTGRHRSRQRMHRRTRLRAAVWTASATAPARAVTGGRHHLCRRIVPRLDAYAGAEPATARAPARRRPPSVVQRVRVRHHGVQDVLRLGARLHVGLLLLVGGQLHDGEGERRRLRRARRVREQLLHRRRLLRVRLHRRLLRLLGRARPPRPTASAARSSAAPIPTTNARRTRRCRAGTTASATALARAASTSAGSTCVPESCSGSTYTLRAAPATARARARRGDHQRRAARTCAARRRALTTCTTSADCSTGNYCLGGRVRPEGDQRHRLRRRAASAAAASASTASAATAPAAAPARPARRSNSVGTCIAADPGTDPRIECDATGAVDLRQRRLLRRRRGLPQVRRRDRMSGGRVHQRRRAHGVHLQRHGHLQRGRDHVVRRVPVRRGGLGLPDDVHGRRALHAAFCSATACFATPVNLAGNGDVEYGTANSAPWTTNGGALDLQTGDRAITAARTAHRHGAYGELQRAGLPDTDGRGYLHHQRVGDAEREPDPERRVAGQPGLRRAARGGHVPDGRAVRLQLAFGCLDADQRHREPGGQPGLPAWSRDAGRGEVGDAVPQSDRRGQHRRVPEPVPRRRRRHGPPRPGNLVGNPNLEAGTTAGWASTGGTLAISTAVFKPGGLRSLQLTRPDPDVPGPALEPMPLGAGEVQRHVQRPAQRLVAPRPDPAADVHLRWAVRASSRRADRHRVPGRRQQLEHADRHRHLPARATPPAGCKLTAAGIYMQQEGSTVVRGTGGVSRSLRRRCVDHAWPVTFAALRARARPSRRARR